MECLSIFDIYKIGVGPSSSHTLGPWKAAQRFANDLKGKNIDSVTVHLFGSLSKTGIGHATDVAVQLGLQGFDPEIIDTEKISGYIQHIKTHRQLDINKKAILFDPDKHILFHQHALAKHPNTLAFKAFLNEQLILEDTYYSLGGGFITKEGEKQSLKEEIILPFPVDKGETLINHTLQTGLTISEIVYKNEQCFRPLEIIEKNTNNIFETMLACVFKGCMTGGILPGGLKVKRRAKTLNLKLLKGKIFQNIQEWIGAIIESGKDFSNVNQWVSCFALAVNEQNAALGRIVTSPTNGAAGVIPAVLLYYYCFCGGKNRKNIERFLFVSGEIGCIFKKGATISAAVGGCQAEIGVSSAMAAGGLTEVLGGTPKQVLVAAEIAMEHHLGLTCDPIRGLVQVPCIERNTMGAIKAITASHLALSTNPDDTIVNFDTVVKTMWETAQDMNTKYKETAEGGLAIQVPVNLANC